MNSLRLTTNAISSVSGEPPVKLENSSGGKWRGIDANLVDPTRDGDACASFQFESTRPHVIAHVSLGCPLDVDRANGVAFEEAAVATVRDPHYFSQGASDC